MHLRKVAGYSLSIVYIWYRDLKNSLVLFYAKKKVFKYYVFFYSFYEYFYFYLMIIMLSKQCWC